MRSSRNWKNNKKKPIISNEMMGFRLSRNYSFADKQERTVGRSKVVQKFPYGNFFPLKV